MPEPGAYRFLNGLLLRAPFFSFSRYAPERLEQVLDMNVFRRALLLASPEFYRILADKGFSFKLLSGKERLTLLKYYNRMSFRPTPFGAFASFSYLTWGNGQAEFEAGEQSLLHLFPDRAEMIKDTENVADHQNKLGLSPLVYRLEKEFRFFRRQPVDNRTLQEIKKDKYRYSLDAVLAEPLTNKLFSLLASGPRISEELVDWINSLTGCGQIQAKEYLNFLVQEGLLVDAGKTLPLIWKGDPSTLNVVKEVSADGHHYYSALERPVSGGPSAADRAELEKGIAALRLLCPKRIAQPVVGGLSGFAASFFARFGEQRVPLLLALDPDAGITYRSAENGGTLNWTAAHRLFLRLWIRNATRGPYEELLLSASDLVELAESDPEKIFPSSTSVLFRKTGGRLLIEHAGGGTATALAGRFSIFNDDVLALCREAASLECRSNPDIVFADISCQSGPHVDNINQRRRIYEYEICLDGLADRSQQEQLLPSDLLLSVKGGEVILESLRLQKRVLPRLSTAFNHRYSGLDVFRLLCDLQYQHVCAGLGLDLEPLFPGLDFYPRVCLGRCVLSPAKWKIKLADIPEQQSDLFDFLERFRLPGLVTTGKGDQQMVFDLADKAEGDFFLQCVKGQTQVTLTEYLLPDRSVKDGHRPIAGQFLGLLVHDEAVYTPSAVLIKEEKGRVKRRFSLGSEWLYLKLYGAQASSDRVLIEIIAPVLNRYNDMLTGWFFIRYTDPEPHIRLRLKIKGAVLGELLSAIEQRSKNGGRSVLLRTIIADSYERELERYGVSLINRVEHVFRAGSELTLAALKAGLPELETALYGVIGMLESFFKSADEQLNFAARSSAAFRLEFSVDKKQKLAMDLSYRALRPALSSFIAEDPLEKEAAILASEMKNISMAVRSPQKRLLLLADLCHMQINRSFASDQRRQELYVWHYAEKYLRSRVAQIEKNHPIL